jgi:threonine/homoserine/homoserine lactone efflux protein
MELLILFFNSFMVGFSGAMMPGPLLAVDIAETPRHGWQAGPILSAGHALAEIAVVVVLSLGVAALAQNNTVASVIGVVGGTALILMGGNMGYETLKNRLSYEIDNTRKSGSHRLVAKGITATLSNPYWFVWWATTGLAFLLKSQQFGWIGPVVFYFGHIMSDFVWFTVVSLLLWKGKRLLLGRGLKILMALCAVFLIYLGGTFIMDGLSGELAIGVTG